MFMDHVYTFFIRHIRLAQFLQGQTFSTRYSVHSTVYLREDDLKLQSEVLRKKWN